MLNEQQINVINSLLDKYNMELQVTNNGLEIDLSKVNKSEKANLDKLFERIRLHSGWYLLKCNAWC